MQLNITWFSALVNHNVLSRKPMTSTVKLAFHVKVKVIIFVEKWAHRGSIITGSGSDQKNISSAVRLIIFCAFLASVILRRNYS